VHNSAVTPVQACCLRARRVMPVRMQTVPTYRGGVNTTVSYRLQPSLGGGYQGRSFYHPTHITGLVDGDLAISDTWAHQIQIMSPAGRLRRTIGDFGVGRGQFWQPGGITSNNYSIFVADTMNHRIQKVRLANLSMIRTAGSYGRGPAQLRFPLGITVFNGSVFVVDSLNHRIAKFWSYALKFAGSFGRRGSKPGELSHPAGIAQFGSELYVTDSGNDRIAVYDWHGTFQRAFGGVGSSPGLFMLPSGIAAADGRLYVTEHHGGRLQVLTTDGEPDHVIDIEHHGSLVGVCSIEKRGYSQLYVVDADHNVVHNLLYRGVGDRPANWYAEIFHAKRASNQRIGESKRSGQSRSREGSRSSSQLDAWLHGR